MTSTTDKASFYSAIWRKLLIAVAGNSSSRGSTPSRQYQEPYAQEDEDDKLDADACDSECETAVAAEEWVVAWSYRAKKVFMYSIKTLKAILIKEHLDSMVGIDLMQVILFLQVLTLA